MAYPEEFGVQVDVYTHYRGMAICMPMRTPTRISAHMSIGKFNHLRIPSSQQNINQVRDETVPKFAMKY